ncbi:MAG: hypothetical protein WBM45_13925 [Woeseiaceae bacterium]
MISTTGCNSTFKRLELRTWEASRDLLRMFRDAMPKFYANAVPDPIAVGHNALGAGT